MRYQQDRAWMEIDLEAFRQNYQRVKSHLSFGCQIIGVVKANAYGLGAVPLARELEDLGCEMLSVAFIEEAMALREGGISLPILLMGPINPEYTQLAADHDFIVPLISLDQAGKLSKKAQSAGVRLGTQVKLDTGLSRLGVLAKDTLKAVAQIKAMVGLPGLKVEGLFTHLCASDLPGGRELDLRQLKQFSQVDYLLRQEGISLDRHCLSTQPLLQFPEYEYEYVRIGALLFGAKSGIYDRFGYIQPVVSLRAVIWQVKTVDPGTAVSYGPTFVTLRTTRLAVVPVGFADGLRRSISNVGHMLVCGEKAPIIGKVCCDYTILDITDIPQAQEGDVVTIFGRDGRLFQEVADYAALYPASVSETTAGIFPRIPRYYCKEGKTIHQDDWK